MSAEVLVKLSNVGLTFVTRSGFRFHRHTVFDGLTMQVIRGETLGVIGSNGSGKSTLLALLGGVLKPDLGDIVTAQHLTVSLQTLALGYDKRLSGRMNIFLQALLMGVRKQAVEENLDAIVEFSGLGKQIDDPLHTYSAGMKSRLGFAVTQLLKPELLLIDEILGVGDEAFRKKSIATIRQRARSKQTVVVVSHNLGLMDRLCDRVIWIDQRRVRSTGSPGEVIAAYRDSLS